MFPVVISFNSVYAHRCRSSRRAGRIHCHGNHFCIHSGTSQAGWHSGSGCGTQSGPLNTRQYLRTRTHAATSLSVKTFYWQQAQTWNFSSFCVIWCSACSLICSGSANQNKTTAATAELGQRMPTLDSQTHLQLVCRSRDQSLLEITPFGCRVVSSSALFFPPFYFFSLLIHTLSLVCSMHTEAHPRGVRSLHLPGRVHLSDPLFMVWALHCKN